MAYKFNITCTIPDEDFEELDYIIFSAIEKKIRERICTRQGFLPTELYQKAIQHALWTIEREVQEENESKKEVND